MSYLESEAHEWGPGGQPSASRQLNIYNQGNRRGAKEFLRDFAGGFNQSWKDNQSGNTGNNRGSATASATDRTGQSASKVASQFGQLGDDITIEKGYRDKGFTVAGTPGRKGILGHVARGVGTAFGGPFGAMAGNVAGSYLDYV